MKKITVAVLTTMLATSAYGSDTYKRLGSNRYEGMNPAAEVWIEKTLIQRERNRKMRQRSAEKSQYSHPESHVELPVIEGTSVESRVHQLDGIDEDLDEIALEERYQQLLAKDHEYQSLQVKRSKRFASPEMEAFQDQWDGFQPGERKQRLQDQMHNIEIRLRRLALENFQNEQQLAEERRLAEEAVRERVLAEERKREEQLRDPIYIMQTAAQACQYNLKKSFSDYDYWSRQRLWAHGSGEDYPTAWDAFYKGAYLYDYQNESMANAAQRVVLERLPSRRSMVVGMVIGQKSFVSGDDSELALSYYRYEMHSKTFQNAVTDCDKFISDLKKAIPSRTELDERFNGVGVLVARYKQWVEYYEENTSQMVKEYRAQKQKKEDAVTSENETILNNL